MLFLEIRKTVFINQPKVYLILLYLCSCFPDFAVKMVHERTFQMMLIYFLMKDLQTITTFFFYLCYLYNVKQWSINNI